MYRPYDYRDTYIRNSLTPNVGTPQDIANVVTILASEKSRDMTGHVISVARDIGPTPPMVAERRKQLGFPPG